MTDKMSDKPKLTDKLSDKTDLTDKMWLLKKNGHKNGHKNGQIWPFLFRTMLNSDSPLLFA